MRKHTLLDIRDVQDYYAALAWLHHDFEEGLTDNLAYMDALTERFIKTGIYDVLVDTLDMAWEQSELTGNFAHFERALHRVLRRTNHA